MKIVLVGMGSSKWVVESSLVVEVVLGVSSVLVELAWVRLRFLGLCGLGERDGALGFLAGFMTCGSSCDVEACGVRISKGFEMSRLKVKSLSKGRLTFLGDCQFNSLT